MIAKPLDEEYHKRQSNIFLLLFQAYLDKYFLDSVEYFKSNLPKEASSEIGNTVFVVAHICELAKRDLALTLWKIYYDDSNDANTIKKLMRYLYKQHGVKYKLIETGNIKKIRPLIIAVRHGFIAHNLMDDTGRVLQISDLFHALQDVRTIFNDLSLKTIDSRVEPLTDTQIHIVAFHEKVGFNLMPQRILNAAERDTEGDEQ